MTEAWTAQRVKATVEAARQELQGLGPMIGNFRGLGELHEQVEESLQVLEAHVAQIEALQREAQALVNEKAALERHIAELRDQLTELRNGLGPAAREVQERLQAQHAEMAANDRTLKEQEQRMFMNRTRLGEQERQLKDLGAQVVGLQSQIARRQAAMGGA